MSLPIISLETLNNQVAKTGDNKFIVLEGNPEATFVVTLSEPSTETITVQITSIDGKDDNNGADDFKDYFGNKLKTLTFAPGETSKTYTLPIINDDFTEVEENIKIVLTDAVNAQIEKIENFLFIRSDDSPKASVSDKAISVNEKAGFVTVGISLESASSEDVTVEYTTIDIDASDSKDYVGQKNGTVTFSAGETHKEVQIAILDDKISEGNESFKFVLKDTATVDVGDRVSTITILDNDKNKKGINIVKGDEDDNNLKGKKNRKNFIAGLEGNDKLRGGDLSDKIIGGFDTGSVKIKKNGKAVLTGGGDVLTGRGGPDIFKYTAGEGADLIKDFANDLDKLALKGAHTLVDVANGTFVDFGDNKGVIVSGISAADLADDIIIAAVA